MLYAQDKNKLAKRRVGPLDDSQSNARLSVRSILLAPLNRVLHSHNRAMQIEAADASLWSACYNRWH